MTRILIALKMKIGLIGYGRMGKIIETLAKEKGHEIVSIVDDGGKNEISTDVEVYIDFSTAEAMETNIQKLCELKIPVVIGTTGWLDQKEAYEKMFIDSDNIGVWGGNFSLGVNLFFKIISESTKLMDKFNKEYDIFAHEFHHNKKIDSPSGTASQIGEFILKNSSAKNKIVTERLDRKIESNELHVSSTRGGSIPGTHSVFFDSTADTIEITHRARSREGFALGAIMAAEKLKRLSTGLHNFSENFNDLIE